MAAKGPVPKRDDQRIRRNEPEGGPADKVTAIGPVKIPPLEIPDAHPFVTQMYEAMQKSAQRKYFEPTDWIQAKIALDLLNRQLWENRKPAGKPSAQQVANIISMLGDLMVTEGDRRRARIEVERKDGPAGGAEVKPITNMYKEIFAQQQEANQRLALIHEAPSAGSPGEGPEGESA